MLFLPAQLGQGPRGQEVTLVFSEGRDRLSSGSGERVGILGNKCRLSGTPREEGASPLLPVGPPSGRNGNHPRNSQRVRKGNRSRTGLRHMPQNLSIRGRQGGGSFGQSTPPCRGTAAQGEGLSAFSQLYGWVVGSRPSHPQSLAQMSWWQQRGDVNIRKGLYSLL